MPNWLDEAEEVTEDAPLPSWAEEAEELPDVVEVRHLEEGETPDTLAAAGVATVKDEVPGGRGYAGTADVDPADERVGGANVTRGGGRRRREFTFAEPIPIVGDPSAETDETADELATLDADPEFRAEGPLQEAMARPGDDATGLEVSSMPAAVRPLYERGLLRSLTGLVAGPAAEAAMGPSDPGGRVSVAPTAGFQQGLAFDEADELYGAVSAGSRDPNSPGYAESRDMARDRYRRAQEADPLGYFAGQAAGTVASSALVPGLGAARGAGLLQRLGLAGAEGAGFGAAAGFGASEGETGAQLVDDTLTGAATGVVVGTGLRGAGEAAGAGGRALSRYADANAAQLRNRAAGIRYAQDTNAAAVFPGGEEALAQRLRDLNISRGFRSTEEAGRRAEIARRGAGERIGAIGREMEEIAAQPQPDAYREPFSGARRGRVDVRQLLDDVEGVGRDHADIPSGQPIAQAARRYADDLAPHADEGMPFATAHRERRLLDSRIPYEQAASHPLAPLDQQRAGFRGRLSRAMEEAIEQNAGPARRRAWQEANRDYGAATIAERGEAHLQRRGNANRFLSLTDSIAGASGLAAVGGATGNLLDPKALGTGLALALGNRAIRGREHAIAATALETIQRIARTNPQTLQRFSGLLDAAARGGESLAARHVVLMQTDPEYRAFTEEQTAAQAAGDE